jgi:hypothetical protein
MRDPIDARIVSEVNNGTFTYRGSKQNLPGIIDSQEDVGGYREYAGGPVPADTDHDGLPDWWETQRGLNPNSPAGDYNDTNGDANSDGYTNMDDRLEYLAQGGTQFATYNCTAGIAADLDGNCKVDFRDYAAFADAWLTESEQANINGDATIDFLDLSQIATDWLKCNRSPVSECEQ